MNRIIEVNRSYQPSPDSFDEMSGSENVIREHWTTFLETLEAYSDEAVDRFFLDARRLIRENGVTYHVHGNDAPEIRPWKLDLIPLIISQNDWANIEAGLCQRAELLNAILLDLYGPRKLIETGKIPPELIYGPGGFLRQCDQIGRPETKQLLLYAADIVHGTDSRWRVISDRTQSPTGVGYALENRTIMARILPGILKKCNIRRLSHFFRSFRSTFESVAPRKTGNPRTVVLTAGAQDENYFEHAYLSNYLGYTLVQGSDLTVRDSTVWLKSVDGLKRVDIIFRRIEDRMCDPLELHPSSHSGVAGLLEAVRQGNVKVVNSLGSSVLENPGLMAFLPALCRELLGEDLKLPSAATWWCGQPKELQYVLDNIEKLVIKPTYRQPGIQSEIGPMLDSGQIAELKAMIRAHPYLYVGQELINNSTTPSFIDGKLEPRRAVLRCFLLGTNGGFQTMPGGLTLSASSRESIATNYESGGIAKDTWIAAAAPEQFVSLWRSPEDIVETAGVLTSRSAENLFYVGLYAERAEGLARLLRHLIRDYQEADWSTNTTENNHLQTLTNAFLEMTGGEPINVGVDGGQNVDARSNFEASLLAAAHDKDIGGSLTSTITTLVMTAYTIRERWSSDSWRVINSIENNWTRSSRRSKREPAVLRDALDSLINDLTAFTGLNMESMTREYGWIMLDIGRRVERSKLLIQLLRKTVVPIHNDAATYLTREAVLAATECLITYRRRYRAHIQLRPVLELLLLDESNPRSLVYQLNRLSEHVAQLPRKNAAYRLTTEEKLILKCSTRLRVTDLDLLIKDDPELECHIDLEKLLRRSDQSLDQAIDLLKETYFSHVKRQRQLVPFEQEIE